MLLVGVDRVREGTQKGFQGTISHVDLVVGARGGSLPLLHKVSFIVWVAVTAVHVLGHLAELPRALTADRQRARPWDDLGSGRGARALLLASSLVGGLVLALAVEGGFGAWTTFHQLHHHFH